MILTCPECATSYFVDEARVPPEGRTVKCSSCGKRWRAFRDMAEAHPAPEPAPASDVEDYEPDPPEQIVAVGPDGREEEIAPPAAGAAEAHVQAADAAAEPDAEETVRRPRRTPPRPTARAGRAGAGAALAWAGVAATVAAVTAVVMFRAEVARVWPASAGLFAAVGLPADRLGLVFDDVKSQAALQGGRPVLSVTGAIRNTRSETVTAPALKVSLLDRAGKPVAARIARPLNADIPPGAKRYFAIAIPDPPAGSATLDIAFEAEGAAAAPSAAQPVEAVLGPEPIEAQPLPAGHG
ncbi:conserved hypothetical protein [Phenylobacterium zucineum HLK1]|uniref:Zinc finger/thioredoxin putative domain-containing protein n=1 Tax=Phenylobacterium zucineum (strain HLK1) TaxID=450851 RepID=B4RFG4_PHEZH|nr:DUF3426 domain-containing protein [Phenylobacterium zucineum]ACG77045.1 conserved hypothetical protein [Phenylobacterium zucineum HLK1]